VIFGENGEGGQPGLLPALRRFLGEHPEWTVKKHYRNNNGLMILTKDSADKKTLPASWRQLWNFTKAVARRTMDGFGDLADDIYERRLAICTLCESRNGERCAECGCPCAAKSSWPTEACPIGAWPAEINE
jgi:hypothetical protein